MKKPLNYVLILITGILLFSCAKEEPTPEILVSATTLSFLEDGTVQTVKITTNQSAWSYATNQDWIIIVKNGNILSISATPNFNVVSRTASITVSAGSGENKATATISIVQSGTAAATLSVSKNSLSFSNNASSEAITVTTNQAIWSYVADKNWLTFTKQGTILTILASQNAAPAPRNAVVTITAGTGQNSVTSSISVSQEGSIAASISVSKNVIELPYQGTAISVTITTNQPSWTFTANKDWIIVSKNGNVLTIGGNPNDSPAARTGTVTLTAGTAPNEASLIINVSQAYDVGSAGAGIGDYKKLFNL